MIEALIELGKSCTNKYPFPLIEVPYTSWKEGKEPKILVVELTSDPGNNIKINGLSLSDYSIEDAVNKYFFRSSRAAQGPAASLSFKLPGKPSTLRQRLRILNNLGYNVDENQMASFIEENLSELKNRGIIAKNVQILVVLKIDGKWPAENEKLKSSFEEEFIESLGFFKNKPVWKKEHICHSCGKKGVVYGGVGNLLKFYTVDKYGYAPELNPKVAWKQYALCKECILNLERGRRAVDDFLTYSFYGKTFWLLPVAVGDLGKVLSNFESFKGKVYRDEFVNLEDRLIYEASLQKDVVSYHFVFVAKDQQALRILLHVEEVLPSILSRYVEVKRKIEYKFNNFIEEAFSETNTRYMFNFFSSTSLKASSRSPGFTDEDFYKLVDVVFRKGKISEVSLISKAMERIRSDMAEMGEQARLPYWNVLEVLLSLKFLQEWGVLKRSGGVVMSQVSSYEEFFEAYEDFFNYPAKKALVLLGVVVQKFLNYQYKIRGSTPFVRQLKNLRLTQKDVRSLFVSLQNKMMEYDIGSYWPKLREGISLYFVESGDKWSLSPDEIGFYIAVGMAMHKHPIFGGETQDS